MEDQYKYAFTPKGPVQQTSNNSPYEPTQKQLSNRLVGAGEAELQRLANQNPENFDNLANAAGWTATPITSAGMTPVATVNVPPPVTPTATSDNASVPPPPTTTDIVNANTGQTELQRRQQQALDEYATQVGQQQGQTTLQNQAEQQAGLTPLQENVNEISAQLEGLNNQATALQNEAQYTIPNAAQVSAEGRGITQAGLAPITASQLRMNQIKQGAIATQALTLKSLAYAALGKLSLAKDAATKAANAKFEQQQIALDAKKAQIDALMPALNAEEKKRALLLQTQLDDRQRTLDQQKQDQKDLLDIKMKVAEYGGADAVTQAALDKATTPEEAIRIAGKYMQDPKAKLELQKLALDMTLNKVNIEKAQYELKVLKEYGGLTSAEYRAKLKEDKKAIDDAKTESEKSRLQGISLSNKITLLDTILDSKAIDSVVGPTPFSRAPTSSMGVLKRIGGSALTGAGIGAGVGLFAGGIGALPGAIGGGIIGAGGGILSSLQGAKDQFTGSSDALIGMTEQFISKEFLQNLIDVKAQGATFGALQKAEQDALTASATYIGQRRIYEGSGEDKQIVGYNMSESDFKRELENIRRLTRVAYERSTGQSFGADEQQQLDALFQNNTSTVDIYFP